ncbi:HAD family hydrolase [Lysobacter koreensis]|uniref:HAD family hydrolase n=1 Tax=Lysobacter koreensis TaxID=266122 RepID=A0ABW2YT08_9GAMM
MDLALFDFDGTITEREMFADFIHAAVSPARLATGRLLLAPLVAGYRLGVVSGNSVRGAVVGFGLRGVPEARARAAGETFAREVLPGVLRPTAMARIAWHRARGDTVAVVSGALDLYLAPWCAQHGLELLCSQLEVAYGRLSGRFRGAQCVGAEKARRVSERFALADFGTVYAYGDTREDRELLGIADRRYFRWQEQT